MANAGVVEPGRGDRRGRRARPAEARNWWLGYLAQKANAAEIEPAELRDHARRRSPGSSRWSPTGTLSDGLARQAVDGVLETGADVDAVVAERGLRRVSDVDALAAAVDEAIAAHPDVAEKIRGGKVAGGRRAGRRGDEGDPRAGRREDRPRADPAEARLGGAGTAGAAGGCSAAAGGSARRLPRAAGGSPPAARSAPARRPRASGPG